MDVGIETPEQAPVYLNDHSLALLESHWAELPKQARCEENPSGWRIRLVGAGEVFREAGFKDGQVIAPEVLLGHAKTSTDKGLVERLLAVFEHIRSNA